MSILFRPATMQELADFLRTLAKAREDRSKALGPLGMRARAELKTEARVYRDCAAIVEKSELGPVEKPRKQRKRAEVLEDDGRRPLVEE